MGVIQDQSFKNTIISYIGLLLGFINVILLYPIYFSFEEFGLIFLMASIALVYTQLSGLGLENIIIRFFPFFKTADKKHSGFFTLVILIGITGFLVITLIYFLFSPLIKSAFSDRSPLFLNYYFLIIPFSLFIFLFNILESTAKALHKIVYSAFLKDILLRFLTTIGILLVATKIFSFDEFILYYIFVYGIIFLLMLLQIIRSGEFKLDFSFKLPKKEKVIKIIKYGLYTLLSFSSFYVAINIDSIMLGSLVGLEIVGVYKIFMFVGAVIAFPTRALSRIVVAVIANCWKHQDLEQIRSIYKKTSINLFIIGSLIYIGILINQHNFLHILNKPELNNNFNIFIILGLFFLIDGVWGLNSGVLSTSIKYRFESLFTLIFLLMCVVLNLILIPIYEGIGAALATFISMMIFNSIKLIFIKRNFNMQPFSFKHLYVVIISIFAFLIGWYLPVIGNVYVDILYRSSITAGIYFALVFIFKLSDDINEKINKYLSKLSIKI